MTEQSESNTISRPAIKRLVSRSGSKYALDYEAQEYLTTALRRWTALLLETAFVISSYLKRMTIKTNMIIAAMKIYGIQPIVIPKQQSMMAIPRVLYRRIISELIPDLRISIEASVLLQYASENYLVELIKAAGANLKAEERVSLTLIKAVEEILVHQVESIPAALADGYEGLVPIIRAWYADEEVGDSAINILSKLTASFLNQLASVVKQINSLEEAGSITNDQVTVALKMVHPEVGVLVTEDPASDLVPQEAFAVFFSSPLLPEALDTVTQVVDRIVDELVTRASISAKKVGARRIARALQETWLSGLFPSSNYVL